MSLQKKTKLAILVVLVLIASVSIAYRLAYQPHVNIADRSVDYEMSSKGLSRKVSEDPSTMLNTIVLVQGTVGATRC